MADIQIVSSTADGVMGAGGGAEQDWDYVHTLSTSNWVLSASTNATMLYASENYDQGVAQIYRSAFYFDTSALEGATINSATLNIYVTYLITNPTVASCQKGTQADTLTTGDFDSFSGSSYGNTSVTGTGWFAITLNSTGIDDINLTGITKIFLREYTHDYLDTAPGANKSFGFEADFANGTNKPYLDIDYTAGATGTNMTVNIDDTAKDVATAYVNVDDAWKEVASAVVNKDDAWKTIF